ncbi:MAG: sigma-70 family RNA polymerase sigma factor [Planctomycetes bacterium]|nr:sigma-70 family RNA polymerase sigma factor [Planctomycetota bacterium]
MSDGTGAEPAGREPACERELIERAQAGDAGALDALCRRHLRGVQGFIRRRRSALVRRRESTLDIAQSVFRLALRDLGRFEPRGADGFRNWLLTYAEHALHHRERFHRAARRSADREAGAPLSQVLAELGTPSRTLVAREELARLEQAFDTLSARDQDIVLMARVEGLSHAEIAAQLGISETASRKALSRALVQLAAHTQSP